MHARINCTSARPWMMLDPSFYSSNWLYYIILTLGASTQGLRYLLYICVCLCVHALSANAIKRLYSILNTAIGFLLSIEGVQLTNLSIKRLLLEVTAIFTLLYDMAAACSPRSTYNIILAKALERRHLE